MASAAARSPADQDRFICIYPAYLNNKKTLAEGRRIPVNKAVENPTASEIQDVCLAVGLNVSLEKNKMYSREWNRDAQYRGRVRVQLKQEDGSLCLVQFPSPLTGGQGRKNTRAAGLKGLPQKDGCRGRFSRGMYAKIDFTS
ncbi:signal recognition particle 19 kDa protein isoform X2 [Echinops telfairi]|uniref:Signal recognition particle 19 kDa protein isoform X2 n=1 Tax=Echinops telfairi TaxID=9371 RepID=A0AC55CNB9_ECHTE|nr:signal recognition particle 19 kDa protein isoform X2 [Echinops telfairi]